jgi:hypothetical protein
MVTTRTLCSAMDQRDETPVHDVRNRVLGKTTVAKQLVQAPGCAYVSLDEVNAEQGLHGGEGVAVGEWERTHGIALARMRMARGALDRIERIRRACPRV